MKAITLPMTRIPKPITKLFWRVLIIVILALIWVLLFRPDWLVLPPVGATTIDMTNKCTSSCTDPNAPSYDLWGNEYSATGALIHATCPNVKDPITGKDNPECVCPAATSSVTYYVQGYSKDTNSVVCGATYIPQCPYANAVPGDSPECSKLGAEQQSQSTTSQTSSDEVIEPSTCEALK